MTVPQRSLPVGEIRAELRQDDYSISNIIKIKKNKRYFTGVNLYIKNYKLNKTIMKLPMSEAIAEMDGIEFNKTDVLDTIKLKGINKYLNLMTRNQMLNNIFIFNLNMNIFENDLSRKQFVNNLQFNQEFVNRKEVLGCYVQPITRTV